MWRDPSVSFPPKVAIIRVSAFEPLQTLRFLGQRRQLGSLVRTAPPTPDVCCKSLAGDWPALRVGRWREAPSFDQKSARQCIELGVAARLGRRAVGKTSVDPDRESHRNGTFVAATPIVLVGRTAADPSRRCSGCFGARLCRHRCDDRSTGGERWDYGSSGFRYWSTRHGSHRVGRR